MIRYTVSYQKPHRQFIDFEAEFPHDGSEKLQIQLPAWRPGRYQLGDFAKNIQRWKAFDKNGTGLPFRKKTKDLWEIEAKGLDSVKIEYNYYASELNAGSTFLDGSLFYINPVNCFFYLPENQELEYEVELKLPEDYDVATGMPKTGKHTLKAKDTQQVMDCPLMASANLQHETYEVEGKTYHIWINGSHHLNIENVKEEFAAFTDSQIRAFGSIPCDEYHFLFHFLPYFVYHGVEHCNSTVITLGPAPELSKKNLYDEFLGISSHELYHTWNIKNIRPAEMMPYDFSRENYSRLGYVAEGVTTYMGDQFLIRSGVYNEHEYFGQFNKQLQKHYDNPGRHNLSVADSSFDTWLDGYAKGVPGRKVSIYTEGCLIAFICDVKLMQLSGNKKSLDDVMKRLYQEFGLKEKGYTEADYKRIMEEVGGETFDEIFDNLVWGTQDFTPYLEQAMSYLGWELTEHENSSFIASHWGTKINNEDQVVDIYPESPADLGGLCLNDIIVSINGFVPEKNEDDWARFVSADMPRVVVKRRGVLKELMIPVGESRWYSSHKVQLNMEANAEQEAAFRFWKLRR